MQVSQTSTRVRSQGASGRRQVILVTRNRIIPSPARVVNEESPPRNCSSRALTKEDPLEINDYAVKKEFV